MNYHTLWFLASSLFIQAGIIALGQIECLYNGNYTRNSTYSANLNTTLSSLYTNVGNNGFYTFSAGQGIDRSNGLVLCRGDTQLDVCRQCVKTGISELLHSCPNQKQAIYWHEFCTLRYSNDTLYGVLATSPQYNWYWDTANVTSPERFKMDLRKLLDDLRKRAASGGSLIKVAAGNVTGPDFQMIFALVQCTPDLLSEDCTSCLIQATADVPTCCEGKVGAGVWKPSCTLRFEIYPFFNESRLLELEPVPVPPPPPLPVPVADPPPDLSQGRDDGNTTRIVLIVVPVVLCLMIVVSAIIWLRKRKRHKPKENPETIDEISTVESLQFAFITIKSATNDFSDDNKLGQGGFGIVYKGKLSNGQEIAVKRLSNNSGQGDIEFKNEVLLLAKLQHRNLVRLLGFALEGAEKLLVYEFVQNTSLDFFIFGRTNHSCLDWGKRYKIIVGIAKGILYLHEDSRLKIIHRDLKVSNILLDKDMNPKIADFGMAILFRQDETQGNTSRIIGTYGYMPPEYITHGQFSIKSDVFSFGVLVLEIISGQRNNNFRSGENVVDLLSFTWKNWREGTAENMVDPLLMSGSGGSDSVRDMLRCIHIGLLCVQENAADRPTMASVVLMLSSSSITLAVPSQPAFYFPSDSGPIFTGNHACNSSSKQVDQYDYSSQNDSSISELYPR